MIVATRLALFPLIFNLSIAQKLKISTEQVDGEILMDSHASFYSAQNDRENTQDSSVNASEWQEDVELVISNESEKSTEQVAGDIQMDFSAMPRNDKRLYDNDHTIYI